MIQKVETKRVQENFRKKSVARKVAEDPPKAPAAPPKTKRINLRPHWVRKLTRQK